MLTATRQTLIAPGVSFQLYTSRSCDRQDNDSGGQELMAAQAEIIGDRALTRRRKRLFYAGMAVAIVLIVFAGFSRTFYLRTYFQTQPLIPLLILHGVV